MRAALRTFGMVLFFLCGAAMWLGYVSSLMDWLGGFFGFLVAVIVAPGALIFPFLYWIVEGVFPTWYFALWGVGIGGQVIAAMASPRAERVV